MEGGEQKEKEKEESKRERVQGWQRFGGSANYTIDTSYFSSNCEPTVAKLVRQLQPDETVPASAGNL